MMKNKLKFKFDFKRTVLFFYKIKTVLFAVLFAGLLLTAFNVCYNEICLKVAIPEMDVTGNDNYIRIEKLKLEKIISEIERRENNIKKEIAKEYQNPFDTVDKELETWNLKPETHEPDLSPEF